MVIHHLEFDAGVVAKELMNAGLSHLVPVWEDIARNGFGTMNPDVCKWTQMCKGRRFEPHQRSEPPKTFGPAHAGK